MLKYQRRQVLLEAKIQERGLEKSGDKSIKAAAKASLLPLPTKSTHPSHRQVTRRTERETTGDQGPEHQVWLRVGGSQTKKGEGLSATFFQVKPWLPFPTALGMLTSQHSLKKKKEKEQLRPSVMSPLQSLPLLKPSAAPPLHPDTELPACSLVPRSGL